MGYNWDNKDLLSSLNELKALIEAETDIKRKMYLEKVYDNTLKLCYESSLSFEWPTPTTKQKLSDILNSSFIYRRYYSIVRTFLDDISKYIEQVDRISDMLEGNPLTETGAYVSDEIVLSATCAFYEGFDEELYPFFKEVYDSRFDTLRILDYDEKTDDKSDGNTLYIDGIRRNFITLYRTGNVETTSCSVHEYGHAIHNLINPSDVYADKEDLFAEVTSMFPELVSLYELYLKTNSLEALYNLYTTIVTYIDKSEYLSLHTPVLNQWKDNNYSIDKDFFRALKEDYYLTREAFKNTIDVTIDDDGIYVLSLIVSLELLSIYKQNKKRALELFKGLLRLKSDEDILTYISINIGINVKAKEEAQVIIDTFEKELNKKRC